MLRRLIYSLYLPKTRGIPGLCRVTPCSYLTITQYCQTPSKSEWMPTSEPEVKQNFSNLDPNTFGTLSGEPEDLNTVLDRMPDELDDKEEFDEVNAEGKKQRRTPRHYHRMIKQLLAEKKIADAIDVLETRMIKKDKVNPDYYAYDLLIQGCGKVGYCDKAFKLYAQMKKRGVKITKVTYTNLINACAHSYFPEKALIRLNHLRQEINEKCVELTIIHYNAMIKAYARVGDVQSAFTVVDEMLEKRFSLDNYTFSALMSACISDKECGLRHALLTWHKMRAKNVTPDIFIYNLFIRCIRDCEFGDEEDLKQVIDGIISKRGNPPVPLIEAKQSEDEVLLEDEPLEPAVPELITKNFIKDSQQMSVTKPELTLEEMDVIENRPNLLANKPHLGTIVSIKSAKTATDRLLLLGGFKNLLKEMERDGAKPTIITFTQLLSIMPSTKDAEVYLMKEIKKYKVDIDIDFCNMLIKQRAVRYDYEDAKEVLSIIQENYLHPDLITFGVLAMCCRNKAEAKELMKDMKAFSYRLNVEILGAMLHQACSRLNFEYAEFIMRLTKALKIQPCEKYMQILDDLDNNCTELRRRRKKKKKTEELPWYANEEWFVEGSIRFKEFLAQWRKEVEVFKPPHPYQQFRHLHNRDPENTDESNQENEHELKVESNHSHKIQDRRSRPRFKNKMQHSSQLETEADWSGNGNEENLDDASKIEMQNSNRFQTEENMEDIETEESFFHSYERNKLRRNRKENRSGLEKKLTFKNSVSDTQRFTSSLDADNINGRHQPQTQNRIIWRTSIRK